MEAQLYSGSLFCMSLLRKKAIKEAEVSWVYTELAGYLNVTLFDGK